MIEIKKKTINSPSNLDFPEHYIVTEKFKSEKTIHNILQ